jgi:8-oxo-dGTP diphosphatase
MTARAPDPAGIPGRPVIPCVGAVVKDGQDRLLLIKRGHEPGAGLWSLPGGRVEPGEPDAQAVQREVLEETGLTVTCGALVGAVQRPGLAGAIFDIRDYAAVRTGGTLQPGDDAADVRWASPAEIASLDDRGLVTDGLVRSLRSWGVLAGPL